MTPDEEPGRFGGPATASPHAATGTIRLEGSRVILHRKSPAPAQPNDVVIDMPDIIWLTAAERRVIAAFPIDTSVGLGAVLLPVVLHLAQLGTAQSPVDGRRHIAAVLRSLLSAGAAERVVDEGVTATKPQRVLIMAMHLMYAGLDEPHLTVGDIAFQLGVSPRTLQAAFRESGTTPAAALRALRAERAVSNGSTRHKLSA